MRILYLVHQFFPKYYTGTERFTLGLAKQMQKMGHSPTVLTYEMDLDEIGFEHLVGEVHIKPYTYQSVPVVAIKRMSRRTRYQVFDTEIEQAFERLGLEFDLLHVCHPLWLGSVVRSCKKRRIPSVLTLTDAWLLCPRETLLDTSFRLCSGPEAGSRCVSNCGFPSDIRQRYKDAMDLLEMVNLVTTSSHFTASLIKRNGYKGDVRVIRHSIDYRYVSRTTDGTQKELVLGFIGTIMWHKGLHVLLRAFRKVRAPTTKLRIYGSLTHDPTYAREMLEMSRGDSRIRFEGSFEIERLPEIMQNISVLVIPSVYYENYPLVMLAALAHGIPVIGSEIGGIPEVIKHGENGMLFEAGNSDELALLIEQIAERNMVIEKLRSNIVPPRRIEEEALDYENIYMKLTSK